MTRRATRLLSLVLLLAGGVMLAAYAYHLYDGASGQRDGLATFAAAKAARDTGRADTTPATTRSPEATQAPLLPPAEAADHSPGTDVDTSEWSDARVAAYESAADRAGVPEGILRIPAVDLEVPVYAGTGNAALTRGAGRIENTPSLGMPGNTGIAAHRDGWFRALKDVRPGDTIEVETLAGSREYRITELLVVEPEDVQVLAPTSRDSLTLVTCYPFYFVGAAPQRFIVRAETG